MSSLPPPQQFRERFESTQELEDELPDRPITSLRDIQYLYGRLYTLATAGKGEYAQYLTPDQARDLIDEEESLIVVRADLSGSTPKIDRDQPVDITRYSADLVDPVAHSKYKAARGFDHSITHRSGRDSSVEKLVRYAKERFTTWATDAVIDEAAAEHEQGWIVRALAELGEDEREMARVERAIESSLGGTTTALLTVRVKLEPDGPYLWPGEVDVFNEAMRAHKLSKLVSKGQATESTGVAVDLITGRRAQTVGTAEDPLNYYLAKQMEKFPALDPDQAWRTHPLSEDAAVTIMNAEELVDGCAYSTFGASVYYLPYFLGRTTAAEAYLLYDILYGTIEDGDMNAIQYAYELLGDEGTEQHGPRLRFYVAAVMKQQMSRWNVYGDTMDGTLIHPVELARAHDQILHSWVYDVGDRADTRISPPLPTHENWSLLADIDSYVTIVTSGAYLYDTYSRSDDDQAASADDARITSLVSILAGQPLSVEQVLSEYVERLLDDRGDSFPSFLVASQFAQLCALASAGLLEARDEGHEGIATPPAYEPTTPMTPTNTRARADGGTVAAARAEKLEQFIAATTAFENEERLGSFLLGVLVGQVGGYQQSVEHRATTVVDQYPIKSMTKTRLKRATEEVLDKDIVYSREKRMRTTMYAEVVDRMVETLTRTEHEPEHWKIGSDDLRFYYSLGIAYGLNNWTESTEQTDEEE